MDTLPQEENDKALLEAAPMTMTMRYAINGKSLVVLRWLEHRLVKILTDVRHRIKVLDKPAEDLAGQRVYRVRRK